VHHGIVTTPVESAHEPARRRFRLFVVVASVIAAAVGSVVLAIHDSTETATARAAAATFRLPGHPGAVSGGRGVLWIALTGDPSVLAADRPLLRLDPATGAVAQEVRLGGEVSALTRDGGRLVAAVRPVGDDGSGPCRLVALDWRSGVVVPLGASHRRDTDSRPIDGPVDRLVHAGLSVWGLEARPGTLLQLDPATLAPAYDPIRLSTGRADGLAAGAGFVWVTATDAGDVVRIAVAGGNVWIADRAGGKVFRLEPSTLRPTGEIEIGGTPAALAAAGNVLFVAEQGTGTVARIDARSGREVGPPIRVAPPSGDVVAPALVSAGGSVWATGFASDTVSRIGPASVLSPTSSDELRVEGTGNGPIDLGPSGSGVTDGGVASTGHFTMAGDIRDKGTYTDRRSVTGLTATIRRVLAGSKGTITIVVTTHLGSEGPASWTIASGTRAYAGLRGKGTLTVDNYQADPYTFVMMGTISR
jgi:hypothetical protein